MAPAISGFVKWRTSLGKAFPVSGRPLILTFDPFDRVDLTDARIAEFEVPRMRIGQMRTLLTRDGFGRTKPPLIAEERE